MFAQQGDSVSWAYQHALSTSRCQLKQMTSRCRGLTKESLQQHEIH